MTRQDIMKIWTSPDATLKEFMDAVRRAGLRFSGRISRDSKPVLLPRLKVER